MTHPDELAPSRADSTMRELTELRAELAELRAELALLRNAAATSTEDAQRAPDQGDGELHVTSRRRLFALAGGAAAAAVAATTMSSSNPVAAAYGTPLSLGNNIVADSGNVISTFLNYSPATSNTMNRNMFVVGDAAAAFNPGATNTAAVSGYASQRTQVGVSGIATVPGGRGVYGRSTTGTGVEGESASGWDFLAGGTGRVYLTAHVTSGPPTSGSYSGGEIVRDENYDLWICVSGGSNSKWRKIGGGGSAGALHIIEPTRVFDSRVNGGGGRLGSGANRSISVANGIDLTTGQINDADVVPLGATAVQFTLTIADATTQGFLAVTPGDASGFKASTINWSPATPSLATGALVKIDALRHIKVFAGGGGSTQFIVDVTGYYR